MKWAGMNGDWSQSYDIIRDMTFHPTKLSPFELLTFVHVYICHIVLEYLWEWECVSWKYSGFFV